MILYTRTNTFTKHEKAPYIGGTSHLRTESCGSKCIQHLKHRGFRPGGRISQTAEEAVRCQETTEVPFLQERSQGPQQTSSLGHTGLMMEDPRHVRGSSFLSKKQFQKSFYTQFLIFL